MSNEVGNKYLIFDAENGEEKKGKYFCLRIDANDEHERAIVELVMHIYAIMHRIVGNAEYADNVIAFVKDRGEGVAK